MAYSIRTGLLKLGETIGQLAAQRRTVIQGLVITISSVSVGASAPASSASSTTLVAGSLPMR